MCTGFLGTPVLFFLTKMCTCFFSISMCIQRTRRAHIMCGGDNRAKCCRHHTWKDFLGLGSYYSNKFEKYGREFVGANDNFIYGR